MKILLCLLIATFICVEEILAKSECEKQHKRALKAKEKWIPECKENGEFEPLQCKVDESECKCVRPDGSDIKEFSSTIKSCDCHVHLDKATARKMVGMYKPQCEEDGTYQTTQCNGSVGYCWCVDEKGHKTNKTDCLSMKTR